MDLCMNASLILGVQLDDLDSIDFADGHRTSEFISEESIWHLFSVYYPCTTLAAWLCWPV